DLASSAVYRPASSGTENGTVFLLFLANPLAIANVKPPAGEVGLAYEEDLGFGGGTPPYTVEVFKGALPDGLSLDAAGTVSGTPTKKGKKTFSVRLADSEGAEVKRKVTLAIKPPVKLVTDSLGKAKHGVETKKKLQAKGGVKPYVFSIVGGGAPEGVQIDEEAETTLIGAPEEVGTFVFTLRVTDAMGASDELEVALKVKSTLKVTSSKLPKGKVGKAYDENVHVKGGVPGYAFEIVDGALPDGVSLVVEEGPSGSVQLAGTPTENGQFGFTIRVTDDTGETAEKALKIKVKGGK
ncbi:MAG: Ig domain-containing protein, partial [Planctomycetota bacterium JB042]